MCVLGSPTFSLINAGSGVKGEVLTDSYGYEMLCYLARQHQIYLQGDYVINVSLLPTTKELWS